MFLWSYQSCKEGSGPTLCVQPGISIYTKVYSRRFDMLLVLF